MTALATNTNVVPMLRTEPPPVANTVQGERGTFHIRPDGIFYVEQRQQELKICTRLRVLSTTRSDKKHDWGRLLEWQDNDGTTHRWAMPMEMLAGDGNDVTRELLRRGLNIVSGKGKKVLEYIQSCESITRTTCTDKTGWHGRAYVTPDHVYGDDAENRHIYQSDNSTELTTGQTGTLEDWQNHVAAYAVGNSRLVFAISTAFAGSLVHPAGMDSGGFHIHGASSTGKSTAQLLAASVWGNPDTFKRTWRATSNGLESVASLHNDSLLILDEIREITGKDASETAYMLGNGQGKTRANRTGGARAAKTWRLLLLSSGEITLTELLQSEGKRTYAGQEVRIANIPADAGQGMGIIENLHGFPIPANLADHIRYETSRYYGTAGAAWLEHITQNHRQLWETLPEQVSRFCADTVPANATGQVHRVAKRFALVAIAGELATRAGITGWNEGEATQAATRCFNDWLADFGGANGENKEHLKILDAIEAYIDSNRSKFANARQPDISTPSGEIAGYWQPDETEGREYWILAKQMETITGANGKTVGNALQTAGWSDSETSVSRRILGKPTKVFIIRFPTHQLEQAGDNTDVRF